MAVTIMPARGSVPRHPWQLLLTMAGAAGCLASPVPVARWGSLAFFPLSGWFGYDWVRASRRARDKGIIRARLSRLPDDFYLLHDLMLPAPWGESHCDAIVISRFGVVVIGAGTDAGWMSGPVEAVRSILFAQGLTRPPIPVRGLILLPTWSTVSGRTPLDVPVVREDELQLRHLAAGGNTGLTDEQVRMVAQCLLHARAVS